MRKKVFTTTRVLVIAFLVSALVVSSLLISNVWGRFFTSVSDGDGARVAKFNIGTSLLDGGVETESFSVSLKPQTSREYKIVIENDSEVSVRCTVAVSNQTKNLPLTFELKNQSEDTASQALTKEYGAGESDRYTLTVFWQNTTENDFQLQGMVDHVIVTVRCEQVD